MKILKNSCEDSAVYTANALNQYTRITENAESVFIPEFDADGNQTRVKTTTGEWSVSYNGENRSTDFTAMTADNNMIGVNCAYDSMGRRSFKQVTVNGSITLHHRYLYRGYLQIACIDLTRSHHPALWLITWDPTQPIATRPLAIQKDGTWYTYGLDLTKNVCEVFGSAGYIATTYTYSPYGSVTSTGSVTQPIQWSSEYSDEETGLAYYNWRYYNPLSGRWSQRDFIDIREGLCLYALLKNNTLSHIDYIGLTNSFGGEKITTHPIGLEPKEKSVEEWRLKDLFKAYAKERIHITLSYFYLDCHESYEIKRSFTLENMSYESSYVARNETQRLIRRSILTIFPKDSPHYSRTRFEQELNTNILTPLLDTYTAPPKERRDLPYARYSFSLFLFSNSELACNQGFRERLNIYKGTIVNSEYEGYWWKNHFRGQKIEDSDYGAGIELEFNYKWRWDEVNFLIGGDVGVDFSSSSSTPIPRYNLRIEAGLSF